MMVCIKKEIQNQFVRMHICIPFILIIIQTKSLSLQVAQNIFKKYMYSYRYCSSQMLLKSFENHIVDIARLVCIAYERRQCDVKTERHDNESLTTTSDVWECRCISAILSNFEINYYYFFL